MMTIKNFEEKIDRILIPALRELREHGITTVVSTVGPENERGCNTGSTHFVIGETSNRGVSQLVSAVYSLLVDDDWQNLMQLAMLKCEQFSKPKLYKSVSTDEFGNDRVSFGEEED